MSATLPMDSPVPSSHAADATPPATRRGSAYTLWLVTLGEGGMLLLGVQWMLWRDLPQTWSDPSRVSTATAIAIGLVAAVAFAVIAFILLRILPERGPVRPMRRLYREVLYPLFRRATPIEIAAISVLAGLGEEVLFRGAVQPELGVVLTSLAFGLCHIGGWSTAALGFWAAFLGALLGWLAIATGGLLAPIVAHMAYDALALSYLRWGPALPDTSDAGRVG